MATEAELSARIEQIKTTLVKLGDLRPGSLSEQYNMDLPRFGRHLGLASNSSLSYM